MKFLYKKNYSVKAIIIGVLAFAMCVFSRKTGYMIIPMPEKEISGYHSNILTINSIFSGFALTNLGILLTMTDDQLIRKLDGTDILQKRNVVIGHSIIFGSISIFISMFWVLKINLRFIMQVTGSEIYSFFKEFAFNLEILSLVISIMYFLLSIVKMIQLLNLLHIPRKRYSDTQIDKLKTQIWKDK